MTSVCECTLAGWDTGVTFWWRSQSDNWTDSPLKLKDTSTHRATLQDQTTVMWWQVGSFGNLYKGEKWQIYAWRGCCHAVWYTDSLLHFRLKNSSCPEPSGSSFLPWRKVTMTRIQPSLLSLRWTPTMLDEVCCSAWFSVNKQMRRKGEPMLRSFCGMSVWKRGTDRIL